MKASTYSRPFGLLTIFDTWKALKSHGCPCTQNINFTSIGKDGHSRSEWFWNSKTMLTPSLQFPVTMSRGHHSSSGVPCPVHGLRTESSGAEYLARLIETNRLCIRIAEEPVSDARLVRKFLTQVMPIFGGAHPSSSPPAPKCIEIEPHCFDKDLKDDDSRCENWPFHEHF